MDNDHAPVRSTHAPNRFRYYDLVMAAFVAILLLSNIIGASKPSYISLPGGETWIFGAGVLFFPISYIIGDVLTEVYGYARARRVIWTGFAALAFMAFMAWVVVKLPPAEGWPHQGAYEAVFGNSWRIVIASMTAFWVGEFANSYVLAKMKVWTDGRFLWMRTIGSTVVGQGLDSLIFYPLAFYGIAGWPPETLFQVVISQWIIKTVWEAVLTPVTYLVVNSLKRREGIDLYDTETDFSPFASEKAEA
ncbi:Putative preQ0 transporter [Altererythrobacter epoxidivorans]|uniref:Probable queuosine precursor transporter n=1 Tax=Altererythrobacter epoxidivorans TaxID=361183 RepID=A0A0M4M509_9SPHN|nr:queuosine precursor transporter [Altererythrobacter epoxidivorans]ALE17003.1 Putative preQ0 transporter [Altererythrobacter epoxidivorans]